MRVDKKRILKIKLKETGKSMGELAKAIGMSPSSISQLISNNNDIKNQYTSLSVLKKLSDYLGEDLTWLASGDGKWN